MKILREMMFKERISVYLMVLKIPPNLKGFLYLRECALRIYKAPEKKHNLKNNLYKELSLQFGDKPVTIERLIRHAISVSVKRDGIRDFERMAHLSFSKDRPSPKELLCLLVEKGLMDSGRMLDKRKELYEYWKSKGLVK